MSELYGTNVRSAKLEQLGAKNRIKFNPGGNADVESEQKLPRDVQIELLHKRIGVIKACLAEMTCLTKSCKENFQHKLLLLRAEMARVAVIMGSNAPFCAEGQPAAKQEFDEAIELYELAIEAAHDNGFMQYEVMALELYASFWLTAPPRPKLQVASCHLMEALVLCEQWGAVAKVKNMRTMYSLVFASNAFDTPGHEVVAEPKRKLSAGKGFSLDLETAIRMAQTFSYEVHIYTKKKKKRKENVTLICSL